jgi:hypothetical protein
MGGEMSLIGPHCPIDLLTNYDLYCVVLWRKFDDDGCERGERINGFDQCPKCGVYYPCIEEPDMWEQCDDGRWIAEGWWGGTVCDDCGLLFVTQPDGTPEAYKLGER